MIPPLCSILTDRIQGSDGVIVLFAMTFSYKSNNLAADYDMDVCVCDILTLASGSREGKKPMHTRLDPSLLELAFPPFWKSPTGAS